MVRLLREHVTQVTLAALLILQVIAFGSLLAMRVQIGSIRQSAAFLQPIRDAAAENLRLARFLDADANLKRDQLALVSMRLTLIEKRLALRDNRKP